MCSAIARFSVWVPKRVLLCSGVFQPQRKLLISMRLPHWHQSYKIPHTLQLYVHCQNRATVGQHRIFAGDLHCVCFCFWAPLWIIITICYNCLVVLACSRGPAANLTQTITSWEKLSLPPLQQRHSIQDAEFTKTPQSS